MEKILEEYGPVIRYVVVFVAIIAILSIVLITNKDVVAGWFSTALQNALNKVNASMP